MQNDTGTTEAEFKSGDENAEQQAEVFVKMGLASPREIRADLEASGYDAAKGLGIDPDHAKTIINGVLAKFDSSITPSATL